MSFQKLWTFPSVKSTPSAYHFIQSTNSRLAKLTSTRDVNASHLRTANALSIRNSFEMFHELARRMFLSITFQLPKNRTTATLLYRWLISYLMLIFCFILSIIMVKSSMHFITCKDLWLFKFSTTERFQSFLWWWLNKHKTPFWNVPWTC